MTRRRLGGRAAGRPVLSLLMAGGVSAALISCGPPGRSAAEPSGRDSAGITIIESAAPLWAAGQGRVVGAEPILELAGPAERPLRAPLEAVRLSDGRFVVAEVQPPAVRYFTAEGRWLYDVGTSADGRSRLESVYDLDVGRGDTVLAYDLLARRGIRYDPNGGLIDIVASPRPPTADGASGFLPRGLAPDGRLLLQLADTPFPFPGTAWSILPDSSTLYWQSPSGALTDSTPRLRTGEIFGFPVETAGEPLLAPLARPLGAEARFVGGADLVWIGDARNWELRGHDGHGQVVRIVRLAKPAVPLTAALRDAFVARYRARGANAGTVQRQFAEAIGRAPFPDTLPAFAGAFVARDSTLWLQHAGLLEGLPGDAMLDWTLIGADGRWLGDLTMPPGFRPTDAGPGWVLGLWSDRVHATRVRLYPLVER
jgi:hypothetical protein